MASLETDPRKRHKIRYLDAAGSRQTIYLGAMPMKQARQIMLYVEGLISAKLSATQMGQDVARWVGELTGKLRTRLAELGLIHDVETVSLVAFLDRYIADHSGKDSTKTVWRRCRKHLLAFFKAGKLIHNIGKADAVRFRASLIRKGLADNTVRRTCGVAKQFFEYACEVELIARNPFRQRSIVTTTTGSPKGRRAYVSEDDARKVLEACPDPQTKLLFALARWGGLRVPSEPLALRWDDVDFDAKRITVTVPKLAHLEGKATRTIPLFPELQELLTTACKLRESDRVVTLALSTAKNFRTRFTRIITRAGVDPWPKLFHTLRASR